MLTRQLHVHGAPPTETCYLCHAVRSNIIVSACVSGCGTLQPLGALHRGLAAVSEGAGCCHPVRSCVPSLLARILAGTVLSGHQNQ